MALAPASQLALRAVIASATAGRWAIDLPELLSEIRSRYPILGACVERRDVALTLRKLHFFRDHDRKGVIAYRYQQPFLTRQASRRRS